MSISDTVPWSSLERWSPVAFSIGGSAILIDVILQSLSTVTSVSVPGWVNILFGLGGIWALLIGLIGFYTLVADSAPRLSLGGVVTGAIGWVALTVGLGWAIILDLTTQTTVAEGPPLGTQIFISALILALLSFLCYGIASSRTYSPSRTVGLLLLLPFVAFLVLILFFFGSNLYGIEAPEGVPLALFGIAALGLIAVGYALRTGYAPLDPAEPTDATA